MRLVFPCAGEGLEGKHSHGDYFPVAFIKKKNGATQFVFRNRQGKITLICFNRILMHEKTNVIPLMPLHLKNIWKQNLFALAIDFLYRKHQNKTVNFAPPL